MLCTPKFSGPHSGGDAPNSWKPAFINPSVREGLQFTSPGTSAMTGVSAGYLKIWAGIPEFLWG